MNTITNRQAICDVLLTAAEKDKDIAVTCSDSGKRFPGSFADRFPKQFVELGIAEQNLVTVSAGLAAMGRKFSQLLRPVFCPPGAMSRPR